MNKSSSLLLRLHLHLLHFLIMNKSSYFQKKKIQKKKSILSKSFKTKTKDQNFQKKRRKNFQKGPWDQRHWARTSQVALKKKKKSSIKIFNSFKKIQDFQIFQKKNQFFLNLSKKKKKKTLVKIFNSLKKFKISKLFKKN